MLFEIGFSENITKYVYLDLDLLQYCMDFLITLKSLDGFCSNFQKRIIIMLSTESQLFLKFEIINI